TARSTPFNRARIIALAKAGLSQAAIAAVVGHARKSLRKWIKAYRQKRRTADASHARRPRATTEHQDML
ncbi:hypothetical protein HPB47_014400, partial [Ixodes persulcatus]